MIKNLLAHVGDAGDMDLIPGLERCPGGEKTTHSSMLAWKLLWTESDGLQSIELQRVRHHWVTEHAYISIVNSFLFQEKQFLKCINKVTYLLRQCLLMIPYLKMWFCKYRLPITYSGIANVCEYSKTDRRHQTTQCQSILNSCRINKIKTMLCISCLIAENQR